jgi:hypothetical protein
MSKHFVNYSISIRSAICRGAVCKGFLDGLGGSNGGLAIEAPISITSAISRASYGIIHREPFDSDKHNADEKKWCEIERIWIVTNRMRWYLKKVGDSFPFVVPFPAHASRAANSQINTGRERV